MYLRKLNPKKLVKPPSYKKTKENGRPKNVFCYSTSLISISVKRRKNKQKLFMEIKEFGQNL